jgi:hypothetical protein
MWTVADDGGYLAEHQLVRQKAEHDLEAQQTEDVLQSLLNLVQRLLGALGQVRLLPSHPHVLRSGRWE